jgi:hypothetical protein
MRQVGVDTCILVYVVWLDLALLHAAAGEEVKMHVMVKHSCGSG